MQDCYTYFKLPLLYAEFLGQTTTLASLCFSWVIQIDQKSYHKTFDLNCMSVGIYKWLFYDRQAGLPFF